MRDRIASYLRAGHSGIYAVTGEERRAEAEIAAAAQAAGRSLWAWSCTSGLVGIADGQSRPASDPMDAVDAVNELPENVVAVFRDLHMFLADGGPVLVRAIKDMVARGRTTAKTALVLGCRFALPPELEREFVRVDFALPDAETLGKVLDGICASAKTGPPKAEARELLLDAAAGMTCDEAENAFALSLARHRALNPESVAAEKAAAVARDGLLEVVETGDGLDDVGGLSALKSWLGRRSRAFGGQARAYGLPAPKGVLIAGIPGTGKTLTARATARAFGRPLLRLDAGRLYGSLVGQSEENLRTAIATAEAMAPCVLMIDEIEKGFSSPGQGLDGGTSSRVLGSFLSWLQDKTAPVFAVATANDVSRLPPELLRKGRFDELWFVDLPTAAEREQIWRVRIAAANRDPGAYDIAVLARSSEGCTGAEIAQAWCDAMYAGFSENREPVMADVIKALAETVPLSTLMSERIAGLRQWARGRARPAGEPETAVALPRCRPVPVLREPRSLEVRSPVGVDWTAVEADVVAVAEAARLAALRRAGELVADWKAEMRDRLDNDFLPLHFRYWSRKSREFRGLGHAVMNSRPVEFVLGPQVSPGQALEAELEAEFSRLVVRPVLARRQVGTMAAQVLDTWVAELEAGLSGIPRRHEVPEPDWNEFMLDLARIAAGSGSDTVPLTLKTAYVGACAVVAAPELARISATIAKPKAVAACAGVKTGLKSLGPVVIVAVAGWEAWDHHRDVSRNLPLLRRDLNEALDHIAETVLSCPESGLAGMIAGLETRLRQGLESGAARRR